ncbi:MAG: LysM peptidoglycan-binding domain-containing protein [Pseudomonadota bacterium]
MRNTRRSLFGGGAAAVIATAVAAVIVIGGAFWVTLGREDQTPVSAPQTAGLDAPQAEAEAAQTEDTAEPPEVIVSETPEAEAVVPSFDVVRVDANGSAVIAGQADALSEVTLRLDGSPVEVTRADAAGNFVALLALDPSDTPRLLSLEAMLEDGPVISGDETVIIAPFAGAAEAVASAAPPDPEPNPDVDPSGASEVASAPEVEAAPDAVAEVDPVADPPVTPPTETASAAATVEADPTDAGATSGAPTVVIADADGARVLQSEGRAPLAETEVQIDAITYDAGGEVTLTGRGSAEADLRIMLDDEPIVSGEVGQSGEWALDLPDVDPGTYTLEIQQLDDDGAVIAQVETPFLREDPDRLAAAPDLVDEGISVVTVQPGFTLWGIAQRNFGEGILYVAIFEENRDQIRNPDLIFPGQIFELPELPDTASAP